MLEMAEYLVTAAMVLLAVSLLAHIALVTAKNRRPAKAASRRAKVSVGAGSAEETVVAAETPTKRLGLAWYAVAFEVVAFVLVTAYLMVRMAVIGHGPFANQHEFAVSFVWGILLVALFFELRYHAYTLALGVQPVAIALLLYAMSLDTGVRPLVPALQNRLMLNLHVGFAIISYGAACVSFGAAVLYLLHPSLGRRIRLPRLEVLDDIGYRAAVVTFPTLTIMIVLGSVWAKTAWGAYWQWDPKETAAFVTWLMYGAYLHARVVRNWRGRASAWLLIVGFITVLFAFFGNHIFGGLHSYG